VQQDKNLRIYLALAIQKNDDQSELWVVPPFSIDCVLHLEALPRKTVGSVHSIRISLTDIPGQAYPSIWLLSQPNDRMASGSDVSRVEISLADQTLTLWKDLSFPRNVQKILAVVPSSSDGLGQGLYFLYEHNGKVGLHVKFVRPGEERGDGGEWSQFDMPCPSTATSIASFTDYTSASRDSALILASNEGLHLYSSADTTENAEPTLITRAACFHGARDLYISQDNHNISIWAHNFRDELGFLYGSIDKLHMARMSSLLPAGRATTFTALVTRGQSHSPARQTLLAADGSGNVTLLSQTLDTGIWRQEPFYAEEGGDLKPVQSYTISLVACEGASELARNGRIRLKTSSAQTITVNGSLMTLDANGTWCQLSAEGELALIIPTNGITNQPLEVLELQTFAGKDLTIADGKIIDASSKVISGLSSLGTPEGLANATAKGSQNSLWSGQGKPSEGDLKNAAACFSAITHGHVGLPSDGSIVKPVVTAASEMRVMAHGLSDGLTEVFMDGFHWIKESIDEVTSWVVKAAGKTFAVNNRNRH
jgi:hypothetical protein